MRGAAVTRLAEAGATEAEIATITGHSLRDVASLLDSAYLSRTTALADAAMRKRELNEARTKPGIMAQTPQELPAIRSHFYRRPK